MIACKVCGKLFNSINSRHLANHSLTRESYLGNFPGAEMQSVESAAKRLAAAQNREAKMTSEMRSAKGAKISAAKIGMTSWNAGKGGYKLEWSDEAKAHRKEIGAWNKNIPMTEEQKKKQSASMIEGYESGRITHWNLGNTVSDEVKEKISNSCKNYKLTPEQKEKHLQAIRLWVSSEKYSPPMTGKPHTTQTKNLISVSVDKSLPEIRKNMEESGRWIPLAQLPEVQKYRRAVWKLTNAVAHKIPGYDESKRGLCSLTEDNWQIDHKLSITQGWLDGVSPEELSHVENLQFIPWRDNLAKWHRSSLTKEELLSNIKTSC